MACPVKVSPAGAALIPVQTQAGLWRGPLRGHGADRRRWRCPSPLPVRGRAWLPPHAALHGRASAPAPSCGTACRPARAPGHFHPVVRPLPRAVLLKHQCATEPPEPREACRTPRDPDPGGLGRGPRICISDKIPGPHTHLSPYAGLQLVSGHLVFVPSHTWGTREGGPCCAVKAGPRSDMHPSHVPLLGSKAGVGPPVGWHVLRSVTESKEGAVDVGNSAFTKGPKKVQSMWLSHL